MPPLPTARIMLDIRQMLAIDHLAASRNFNATAAAINVSQATLSRLITQAEDTLGTSLFQRGWSGAETTSEGDIVLRCCKAAIAEITRSEALLFPDAAPAHPPFLNNLRLRQLQTIAMTVRTGTVSQSAARLGRRQSDVSRMLGAFADRFGLDLFRRHRTGMTPLPAAHVLTELYDSLQHQIATLPEMLRGDPDEVTGRVSVGILPFSGQGLISKVFARLTNLHPKVRLVCVPGSYAMLAEALRRHEIDRILGTLRGSERPDGFHETHLYDESFAIVARRDHPVSGPVADIRALRGQNWVVAPDGTPVRRHFDSLFQATDPAPAVQTCEIWSFSAVEDMLVESDSLAMLSYGAPQLANLRADLKQIRVRQTGPGLDADAGPDANASDGQSAKIGLTRLDHDVARPALRAFESILQEAVTAMQHTTTASDAAS